MGGHHRRVGGHAELRRAAGLEGHPVRAGPVGARHRPRLAVVARAARVPPTAFLLMAETSHLIGLLLGTEEDWPTAFETLIRRLGTVTDGAGRCHRLETERVTIEPFDLR